MTIFSHTTPLLSRSFVFAALMGATMLAGPVSSARAADAVTQPAQVTAPPMQAGAGAVATKGETVEQRITTLHTALKITPDESAKWDAVAQAMRENATNMDKLVAEDRKTAPASLTAMDDLKMYQKVSQAHVDGLKNLISSFSTLYAAMPDAQKKIADTVFQSSHHDAANAHG